MDTVLCCHPFSASSLLAMLLTASELNVVNEVWKTRARIVMSNCAVFSALCEVIISYVHVLSSLKPPVIIF